METTQPKLLDQIAIRFALTIAPAAFKVWPMAQQRTADAALTGMELTDSEYSSIVKILSWLRDSKLGRAYCAISLNLILENGVTTLAEPSQKLRFKEKSRGG